MGTADPSGVPAAGVPGTTAREVSRREFLGGLAATGAGAAFLGGVAGAAAPPAGRRPRAAAPPPPPPPPGGGARGGAPPDGAPVDVLWEVAADAAFTRVAAGGVVTATAGDDHCVHVRVGGLRPDRWYHYRFTAAGARSRTGRLRTAPRPEAAPGRLRFAFASCQQRNESHYVAHRAIAGEGVDFLLHLGDYVYVSDEGTVTLADYRDVHRRFKTDPLLQDCHAAVPLVAMWDDGEFYNGVDHLGDPARLEAAKRAWFDYMPMVPGRREPYRTYRRLPWGALADMFVLDVRAYRDPAIEEMNTFTPEGARMAEPGRTTLGAPQKRWLLDGLGRSSGAWRLLGSPYNMLPWRLLDLDEPWMRFLDPHWPRNAGVYVPNEAWDDYQAERREILGFLAERGIGDNVVVSGHTHFFLAGDLSADYDDAASPVAAAEFSGGSLTADPDPRALFDPLPREWAEGFIRFGADYCLWANRHLRHVNLLEQGYAVVEVTTQETLVEFRLVDTSDPDAEARTGARFRVRAGVPGVEVLGP